MNREIFQIQPPQGNTVEDLTRFTESLNQALTEISTSLGRITYSDGQAIITIGGTSIYGIPTYHTDGPEHKYPETPTGVRQGTLEVKGGGSSFNTPDCEITWERVTDFAGVWYLVQVINPTTGALLREDYVVVPWYNYTFSMNKLDNAGTPIPSITFRVWGLDSVLTKSATYLQLTATNATPSVPGTITSYGYMAMARFTWAESSEQDWDHTLYRFDVESEGYGDWISTRGTSADRFLSEAEQTSYTNATVTIQVKHVDVFGQESSASSDTQDCDDIYVDATALDDFEDISAAFPKIPIPIGDNWSDSGTYATWDEHSLWYDGTEYTISTGNTSAYSGQACVVYWYAGDPDAYYVTTGDVPDYDRCYIVAHVTAAGAPIITWMAIANAVIGSAYIKDAAITNAKIGSVACDKLTAGSIEVAVEITGTGSLTISAAEALIIASGGDVLVQSGGNVIIEDGGNVVFEDGAYGVTLDLIGASNTFQVTPDTASWSSLVLGGGTGERFTGAGINTTGNINLDSSVGSVNLDGAQDVNIDAGDDIILDAVDDVDIEAGGIIFLNPTAYTQVQQHMKMSSTKQLIFQYSSTDLVKHYTEFSNPYYIYHIDPTNNATYYLHIGESTSDNRWKEIRCYANYTITRDLVPDPTSPNTYDCGNSSYYWKRVHAGTYYYKTTSSLQSFDKFDDLSLAENIDVYIDEKTGKEHFNVSSLPNDFFGIDDETGETDKTWLAGHGMIGLQLGTARQVGQITTELYEMVDWLVARTSAVENKVKAIEETKNESAIG
jgi:hypothetical protein